MLSAGSKYLMNPVSFTYHHLEHDFVISFVICLSDFSIIFYNLVSLCSVFLV